jgi:hypothetical protein
MMISPMRENLAVMFSPIQFLAALVLADVVALSLDHLGPGIHHCLRAFVADWPPPASTDPLALPYQCVYFCQLNKVPADGLVVFCGVCTSKSPSSACSSHWRYRNAHSLLNLARIRRWRVLRVCDKVSSQLDFSPIALLHEGAIAGP